MIKISQIKVNIKHSREDLEREIRRYLKGKNTNFTYKILKKSIDARKGDLKFVYSVAVKMDQSIENKILKSRISNITRYNDKKYEPEVMGQNKMENRPVVIGYGPAGMFCTYLLSMYGYKPIVIERGENVENRQLSIDDFFENDKLDENSNVLFGEGGAGTFSDGKLNTLVKDKLGRNDFVLETFVKFGADESITYENKPHIGTDVLSVIVRNMREWAKKNGADFFFNTKMEDFTTRNGKINKIITVNTKNGDKMEVECDNVILATGHSSRDTFEMIYNKKAIMEPKSFAMGIRIEHPREMIDKSQYGKYYKDLPAANYKLTHKASNGRGVYSFCMCPGGYVVNSSSEKGRLCVNGMSYSGRNSNNSNSAIIVTVTKDDFPDNTPLGGIRLQRELEEKAYNEGQSHVPVQMYGDFKNNIASKGMGEVQPLIKGKYTYGNLRNVLPEFMSNTIIEGVEEFAKRINGFNRLDAVVSGIEARTSSPLRIVRDEDFQSNILGLYPCGEGAGYAGGITSAAMDGMKVAEEIMRTYAPLTE